MDVNFPKRSQKSFRIHMKKIRKISESVRYFKVYFFEESYIRK